MWGKSNINGLLDVSEVGLFLFHLILGCDWSVATFRGLPFDNNRYS